MKKKYGKAYTKPSGRPTFKFLHEASSTVVEAFESIYNVEVYQTTKGHEQRVVMPPSQFDKFYNLLVNSGFVKV